MKTDQKFLSFVVVVVLTSIGHLEECDDIKSSDGEAPTILEIGGMWSTPFIAIAPKSTLTWNGCTW